MEFWLGFATGFSTIFLIELILIVVAFCKTKK